MISPTPNPRSLPPEAKRKYLSFRQDRSRFAIALTSVREVLFLSKQQITPVPNTQPFLLGLTNLRGEILSVADFGIFLGLKPVDSTQEESRILVVEAPDPRDLTLPMMRVGLAISRVEGVVSLNPDKISSAADASAEIVPFLQGLYNHQGHLLTIVDIEAIAHCPRW